jgi:hypothetical protein
MVRVIGYAIAQHLPWVLISLAILVALVFLVRNQMKSSKQ